MFEKSKIKSYRYDYELEFDDNILNSLSELTDEADFFVIDKNVFELYPEIADFIKGRKHRIIEATEEEKSYKAIIPLIENLTQTRFTKANKLIAIGGGVIQDITAFTASIFSRGTPWIFVPTTLLAQCDSCIGSKTSINFGEYKNQVGGFFPPRKVLVDFKFLKTLPELEIRAGLGEMMHYFLVDNEESYQFAKELFPDAPSNIENLKKLIAKSLSIKKAMIEIDEFDSGPRNVFNYGHSFGHAIEASTNYKVPHGMAVAFGMDIANMVSNSLGLIEKELRNDVRKTLSPVFDDELISGLDLEKFFAALKRDKKNEGKNIKVILTRGIGDMFKTTLVLDDEKKKLMHDYFSNKFWHSDL